MPAPGRRRSGALDRHLEAWARWVERGAVQGEGGGGSMLSRLIDNRGCLIFGGGGGAWVPIDDAESAIEMAVSLLRGRDALAADALRLEYAAGWRYVVTWRALAGYRPEGQTQLTNALALGVSVRTYRGRLAIARRVVAEALGVNGDA